MRLKFLFFPIMLIISVSIFIGYIWPEISVVRSNIAQKNVNIAELDAINSKKVLIETYGKKLSSNSEVEAVVKNYLPEKKTEERVISSINYLANDANVALVDFSLGSVSNSATESSQLGLATLALPSTDPAAIDPVTGQPIANEAPNTLKSTTVSVSVSGEYEKIRMFLNGLAHAPMFNKIKSLEISKQADSETDGEKIESKMLLATITVEFGHLGVAKATSAKLDNFKPEVDTASIEVLQKYVSLKSQPASEEGGPRGKQNPFLPN
ncbi:MAG: hypothetical protein US25_C0002G0016 [Candidatus Moranbacteria bacterium GW2011_GWE1_36_7]|nr:MAG: hypothetical protein UR99_C0011G0016 [Candidatus Moranbacteria bacterium GW2011_GWD2_36_12]KKQ06604.1 MAG: hypothetical protein US16_C0013G0016 [Candidatus Moranbacteria bacterium GW2011_GWE2_36_40]KKQ15549.1 MAG: hypothetical protein US25_C0002G0016 [Candidatus Moranbacteria bacterium GW2011_GWE1_36_7]